MPKDVYEFYKENKSKKIWKVAHYKLNDEEKRVADGNFDIVTGELLFSFDKKKIYNLWTDYPQKFTQEEKELFDKENSYWADFFKDRCDDEYIENIKKRIKTEITIDELIEIYVFIHNKFYNLIEEIGEDAYKNELRFLYVDVGNFLIRKNKKYRMDIDRLLKEKGFTKVKNNWVKN